MNWKTDSIGKGIFLGIVLIFLPLIAVAEEPPIEGSGWKFDSPTKLNGKKFLDIAPSYLEQDGYALVSGAKIHYWLYDTYTYHNGDGIVIVERYIPHWLEQMGYGIDFDTLQITSPNTDLASSVIKMMTKHGCDVSIALITENMGFAPYDFVVINNFDKSVGIYETIVYQLYKLPGA